MTRALCVCLIVVGSVAIASSQSAVADLSIMLSHDRPGAMNVLLGVKQATFYLGDPAVSVPAEPIAGATLLASRFAIRAWQEDDGAKVVVYAVVQSDKVPAGQLEVPIGTYALSRRAGRVRVTETERWGASPLLLRLVRPLH